MHDRPEAPEPNSFSKSEYAWCPALTRGYVVAVAHCRDRQILTVFILPDSLTREEAVRGARLLRQSDLIVVFIMMPFSEEKYADPAKRKGTERSLLLSGELLMAGRWDRFLLPPPISPPLSFILPPLLLSILQRFTGLKETLE